MESGRDTLDFIVPVSKATLSNFLNTFSNGVVFSDEYGKTLFANQRMGEILGFSANEISDRTLDTFLVPKDRPKLNSTFRNVINDNETNTQKTFETTAIKKDGDEVPISISYSSIYENGKKMIFCIVEDISQHINLQKQLYKQAITDPLTTLYNRRHFDERLFQEFTRSNRYCRPFSVIIIDIDGFKQANDNFGHSFGDQMLVKSTKIFESVLREGDSIYRYGGDEFAMLLPETIKEGSVEVAERLKTIFATDFSGREERIRLSLSIGIASYPEDGKDEKGLIGAADRRMYLSKEYGGNMVTAYDEPDYLRDDTSMLLRSLSSLATLMEKSRGLSSHGLSHSQGIRTLAIEIAHRIGLSDDRIALLEQASILHDIGSIIIPSAVFYKKESLEDKEISEIKRHTLIGEEIIDMITPQKNHEELIELKQIIGQHHERMDGSGYPRGLNGDEIRIEAKILGLADAYNAMRSKRPYRSAMPRTKALDEIKKLSGVHFDTEIVDHLFQIEARQNH